MDLYIYLYIYILTQEPSHDASPPQAETESGDDHIITILCDWKGAIAGIFAVMDDWHSSRKCYENLHPTYQFS